MLKRMAERGLRVEAEGMGRARARGAVILTANGKPPTSHSQPVTEPVEGLPVPWTVSEWAEPAPSAELVAARDAVVVARAEVERVTSLVAEAKAALDLDELERLDSERRRARLAVQLADKRLAELEVDRWSGHVEALDRARHPYVEAFERKTAELRRVESELRALKGMTGWFSQEGRKARQARIESRERIEALSEATTRLVEEAS